jgi:hypothetical protein
MAHFGLRARTLAGRPRPPAVPPYQVQATPTGVLATQCLAWQPKSSLHAQTGAMVEYTYEVNAPYTAVLTKVPDPATVALIDFRESIALFVCPVTPEEASRVWFRLAMNDFDSPDASACRRSSTPSSRRTSRCSNRSARSACRSATARPCRNCTAPLTAAPPPTGATCARWASPTACADPPCEPPPCPSPPCHPICPPACRANGCAPCCRPRPRPSCTSTSRARWSPS